MLMALYGNSLKCALLNLKHLLDHGATLLLGLRFDCGSRQVNYHPPEASYEASCRDGVAASLNPCA